MLTTPVNRTTRHALAWPAVPTLVGLALLAVLAAGAALGPSAEAAAPCHVPGDYATLQAAVAAVDANNNNLPSCTIINIVAGTYAELITISHDVTLRGAGQDRTILDGNGDGEDGGDGTVVTINSGAVVPITGVTIQGGFHRCCISKGGGILNEGTLTLENSTVTDNQASSGGGLFNASGGTLSIRNSTVSGNRTGGPQGVGGGIYNDNEGILSIRNSTLVENTAVVAGGLANVGTLTMANSTVAENTAASGDGGVNVGTLTITNSTVTGNTAVGGDGGLANVGTGTLTMANSTVTGNEAAGAGDDILNQGSTMTLTHVTVDQCAGTGCP